MFPSSPRMMGGYSPGRAAMMGGHSPRMGMPPSPRLGPLPGAFGGDGMGMGLGGGLGREVEFLIEEGAVPLGRVIRESI